MSSLLVVVGAPTASTTITAVGNNGGAGDHARTSTLYSNDTNDTNAGVFLIRQGATLDTQVDLTGLGAASPFSVTLFQYRGVNTTTPQDVTATTATGINTDRADPAAITPVTSGAKIVVCYAASQGTLTAWTAPGDVSNFVQQAASSKARAACGDKAWTSGAFDPAALTGGTGSASDSWAAVTLALRPAVATYNDTLSETAAAGASPAAAATFAPALSESAAGNATSAAAATFVTALSESAAGCGQRHRRAAVHLQSQRKLQPRRFGH
jgi:hypothetical protein